jgi:GTPase SAR1 family protein
MSFHSIDEWHKEVKRQAGPECIFMLVGTQSDKDKTGGREVELEQGLKYIKSKGIEEFWECSSKTG